MIHYSPPLGRLARIPPVSLVPPDLP